MTVLYSEQARNVLDALELTDRRAILYEMRLIDAGLSICYEPVRNEALIVIGLRGPFRAKFMSIAHERGGMRSIFYFAADQKTLVAVLQYRDSNPYGDGK